MLMAEAANETQPQPHGEHRGEHYEARIAAALGTTQPAHWLLRMARGVTVTAAVAEGFRISGLWLPSLLCRGVGRREVLPQRW